MDKIYNREYTPEKIESLNPKEVFVFGSNRSGFHVGGAAKIARKAFGAIYGQAEGFQGQCLVLIRIWAIMLHFGSKNPISSSGTSTTAAYSSCVGGWLMCLR